MLKTTTTLSWTFGEGLNWNFPFAKALVPDDVKIVKELSCSNKVI
jgi:hypothetical protein